MDEREEGGRLGRCAEGVVVKEREGGKAGENDSEEATETAEAGIGTCEGGDGGGIGVVLCVRGGKD